MRFGAVMARSHHAMCAGDFEGAYRLALEAVDMHGQNPEIPAIVAYRAAVLSGDPDRIREAVGHVRALPGTGSWSIAFLRHAEAAVTGLDGRTAEAASEHVAGHAAMVGLGQHFDAAIVATIANILLPGRPELRPMVEQTRETLTRIGAPVWLARLEAALASSPATPTADAPATTAEVAAE
jgi:hypothetical protein